MPNIKIAPRETTIGFVPGAEMRDQDITPKIADTSTAWGSVAKAGESISNVANAIAGAERRSQYFKAQSDLMVMTSQLEDEYSKRRDYGNFDTDLAKQQQQAMTDFQGKYGMAFNALEPHIKNAFQVQKIKISHIAQQLKVKSLKADWMAAGDSYQELIAKSDKPEDRNGFLGEYETYTKEMQAAGVIDDVQAQTALHSMRSKSSMTAFKTDLSRNIDEAERRLTTEKDTHYPWMNPDDEIKAGNLIEVRRREMDRKAAAEQREVHNTFAKEAYDRRLAWKKGKSPDGVGFQEWLIQARENDLISESTFQMHSNAIERAADRAATGERKMTAKDWIEFGKIKGEFMTPGSDKSWDDIGALSNRFPNSRISELVNIVAKQPSATRKALISNNWGYVNKRLSEGKASADTWKEINDKWNAQLEVTADKDVPALAKELVKEIPQGGFSPMLEQLRKEKEVQKQKPGFFKSLFKFNPSTGQLEGGKK